ncbi:MAG TPA: co-chaperone GroES [Candidatus Saccharimonadales bacterium]|nr:co-chaperone GroES [Candidatus Saccharimonadales bacterium]
MSNIQPLADYVVAQAEEVQNKTAGGLFVPGGATEKPKVAVVVAAGPGRVGDDNERVPMEVKAGDRIIYSYSTSDIKVDGKTYLIIKEDSILAVVKD